MFTNDKLTMPKYLYNFPTDLSETYAYARFRDMLIYLYV